MKKILITNDDGYESKGLKELVKMLKKEFDVKIKVVAPSSEKSACSHSISLTKPLKLQKIKKNFYKLDDGTPSDCVYIALHALYKNKLPDLIISGINQGANVGEDITYSGTCGGAMEAVLQGIPAIALSQYFKDNDKNIDYKNALKITKKIIKNILNKGFPLNDKEFLNINFPSSNVKFKGIKIAKAGKRVYNYKAHSNVNPRNIKYYWLGICDMKFKKEKRSDITLLDKGYATITPIMLDLTAYKKLKIVKKWMKNGKI